MLSAPGARGRGRADPHRYCAGQTGSAIRAAHIFLKASRDWHLSSQAFTLDDNVSYTFDFFNIWTTEASVNNGEDTNPQPISATPLARRTP